MANGIRGSIGIGSYIAQAQKRLYGEISCWVTYGVTILNMGNKNQTWGSFHGDGVQKLIWGHFFMMGLQD